MVFPVRRPISAHWNPASRRRSTGSVNAVAPLPETNFEFAKALGSTVGRPTVAAVPGFAVRLLLGEMADALLLASTRVSSQKLEASGFHFQHRDIGPPWRIYLDPHPREVMLLNEL